MNKRYSFFSQVGIAFRNYGKAISFVFEKGLWIYFIYSIVIAGVLFLFGFELIHKLAGLLEAYIMSFFSSSKDSLLAGTLNFILTIALNILFFFVFSTFSKYVLLILMSPVMSRISERTEEIITGRKYPFSFSQLIRDVARGTLIALRNMLIEFSFVLLGFVALWIPVIDIVYPVFLFVISWYFYGFSMLDYISERRKAGISKSVTYVRANKGLAIGNGFLFALIFSVPLVGGMIAAILAPAAACAAALELEEIKV
ncbi:MAG: EI24 domain-containing protein [Bacteroidia bacterium]